MLALHLLVCFAVTTVVEECAHGTFADFLGDLPNKMEEAFVETWIQLKNNLSVKLRRTRRMGIFKTSVTPTVLNIDYTTGQSNHSRVEIPVLPSPRSRYEYLWNTQPKTMKTQGTPATVHSALPVVKETKEGATEKTRFKSSGNSYSYKFQFKKFRLRVFYKWDLDSL